MPPNVTGLSRHQCLQCGISRRPIFSYFNKARKESASLTVVTSAVDRFRGRQEFPIDSTVTHLRAEDIADLRRESDRLLSYPLTSITRQESNQYLVSIPRVDLVPFSQFLWKHFIRFGRSSRKRRVKRYMMLVLERLENIPLHDIFNLDSRSFNQQLYLLFLHVWILRHRLFYVPAEGPSLSKELQQETSTPISEWIALRGLQRRWKKEVKNVYDHAGGFCHSLDGSITSLDVFPARLRTVLYRYLFQDCEGITPDHPALDLLTIYTIRQMLHVANISDDHILNGSFMWADFQVHPDFPTNRVVPAVSHRIRGAGYYPDSLRELLSYDTTTNLLLPYKRPALDGGLTRANKAIDDGRGNCMNNERMQNTGGRVDQFPQYELSEAEAHEFRPLRAHRLQNKRDPRLRKQPQLSGTILFPKRFGLWRNYEQKLAVKTSLIKEQQMAAQRALDVHKLLKAIGPGR